MLIFSRTQASRSGSKQWENYSSGRLAMSVLKFVDAMIFTYLLTQRTPGTPPECRGKQKSGAIHFILFICIEIWKKLLPHVASP